jgi:hypothetical protein
MLYYCVAVTLIAIVAEFIFILPLQLLQMPRMNGLDTKVIIFNTW